MNRWSELLLALSVVGLILLLCKLFGAPIPWGVVIVPFTPLVFSLFLLLMGGIVLLAQEWQQRRPK